MLTIFQNILFSEILFSKDIFFSCELLVTWIQSRCMLFKWKLDEQILVAYTILNWKKNFHISCVSASRWINRSHEQRFFKTTINCFLMKQFQWHELCDAFDSIYMRKAIRNAYITERMSVSMSFFLLLFFTIMKIKCNNGIENKSH